MEVMYKVALNGSTRVKCKHILQYSKWSKCCFHHRAAETCWCHTLLYRVNIKPLAAGG